MLPDVEILPQPEKPPGYEIGLFLQELGYNTFLDYKQDDRKLKDLQPLNDLYIYKMMQPSDLKRPLPAGYAWRDSLAIGRLSIPEAKDEPWYIGVLGQNHLEEIKPLAEKMSVRFFVKIQVQVTQVEELCRYGRCGLSDE